MNDEVKVFDVKPYLDKGIFKELRELSIFNSVKPYLGSIQWQNGQDFCPDTLYLDSVSLEQFHSRSRISRTQAIRGNL